MKTFKKNGDLMGINHRSKLNLADYKTALENFKLETEDLMQFFSEIHLNIQSVKDKGEYIFTFYKENDKQELRYEDTEILDLAFNNQLFSKIVNDINSILYTNTVENINEILNGVEIINVIKENALENNMSEENYLKKFYNI